MSGATATLPAWWDSALVAAYVPALVALGAWASRRQAHPEDYFLASRASRWPAIGLAMLASNISSTALIGLAGAAYATGILPQCAPGELPPGCFNYDPYTVNLSGSQNPYSPEWTFNAGVEYAIPVGAAGRLTPRINYSYIGHQWTTLFEAPLDYLPSQGLWSGSLTYERQEWRVQAYGLNLANKVYVAGQFAPGTNPDSEFLGNSRQYGIRVYRSF